MQTMHECEIAARRELREAVWALDSAAVVTFFPPAADSDSDDEAVRVAWSDGSTVTFDSHAEAWEYEGFN